MNRFIGGGQVLGTMQASRDWLKSLLTGDRTQHGEAELRGYAFPGRRGL